MKKYFATLALSLFALAVGFAQKKAQRVVTTDVDNFWVAYDSMRTTQDSVKQLHYLQTLYLDKGTPGLKAMREVRNYKPEEWVNAIRKYPKFWNSLRPRTQLAKSGADGLEPHLKKLRQLYPPLKPANIYFAIGVFRTSGTYKDSLVLVGAELVTGNSSVDVSELPQNLQTFLRQYYSTNPFQNMIPLNVHEYVHTQQKSLGNMLLGTALMEGACDFMTELVTGKTMPLPYMEYGPAHLPELKEKFKAEMFETWDGNWFYNRNDPHPDLGYFMGYAICKAYYAQAKNKQQAIKEIIELQYDDDAAVEAFLTQSKFYQEPLNKAQLRKAYAAQKPVITRIIPFAGADSVLDATVQEIRLEFSSQMLRFQAADYGSGGEASFPVVGRVGFSPDMKSYGYKVDLKPGRSYSFKISGFRATDGKPLDSYEIRFRTKP
ncbi:hypothetical protein EFA69_06900 [Rufibacter immobilis]|uniref:DUF2268 domain-containing protein n=1 Tax=Rufibacter immobilis TaxID=1348778 RepID=A0A3M9MZC5_9BACT|nr:hypothetical protein [Rufibacter immobilis]RNI30826.1 hypothetical protein EFA69_06900 [Rufibacter immobilis]